MPSAADDAPPATVAHAWCAHGVFAVVTAPLHRQKALAVAENRAVFLEGERAASKNEPIDTLALRGQINQSHCH